MHIRKHLYRSFLKFNTVVTLIPQQRINFLQLLDIFVNSVFKSHIKQEIPEWNINRQKEFTKPETERGRIGTKY